MNLIIWRHAEAEAPESGEDDLARVLTARGHRQAKRIAGWLNTVLPDDARVLCSPARRTIQTADALERKFKLRDELAPNGTADRLIELVRWPLAKPTFVVIGHQPMLGQVIAKLMGLHDSECPVKKGAVWWLQHRRNDDGSLRVQVAAVMSPDLI